MDTQILVAMVMGVVVGFVLGLLFGRDDPSKSRREYYILKGRAEKEEEILVGAGLLRR